MPGTVFEADRRIGAAAPPPGSCPPPPPPALPAALSARAGAAALDSAQLSAET